MRERETRRTNLRTDTNRLATVRIKKRPRGKPFEKGNNLSLPYRWKKGESGNPDGRPHCKEISKALRELLASEKPFKPRTGAEKLAVKWFFQSLGGNISALISLADRCEGRPNLSVSLDGGGDNLTLILAAMQEESRRIGPPEGQIRELLTDGQ